MTRISLENRIWFSNLKRKLFLFMAVFGISTDVIITECRIVNWIIGFQNSSEMLKETEKT